MNEVNLKNFWYIACQSHELKKNTLLSRTILDEWIVLFRDQDFKPVALLDKCIHRNAQLSKGRVRDGQLQCNYHGWTFNGQGKLTHIPSEGPNIKKIGNRCAKKFEVKEVDDFIYVRLEKADEFDLQPFPMPFYKSPGYKTVRLFNQFENNVLNCAENYIDVPHTVFVHDGIFRKSKNEKIVSNVLRKDGAVHINYKGETDNVGWFSWFLNPKKTPIVHKDNFYMPNVTSVQYKFGKKEFWISSHCTPIHDNLTWVYTDLTFNFGNGLLNFLAAPIVKFQGQSVINQDKVALNEQMKVIEKYGDDFSNSTADTIHVFIESIYSEILQGRDPRRLPHKNVDIEFWI